MLEAAQLLPYRGPTSNPVTNGLLLRVDIHGPLDLEMLAIHPHVRLIVVSKQLTDTEYADIAVLSTATARPDPPRPLTWLRGEAA